MVDDVTEDVVVMVVLVVGWVVHRWGVEEFTGDDTSRAVVVVVVVVVVATILLGEGRLK